MEPTNISIIGAQLTNLTNTTVSLITFQNIYSYIFLEILILSFYIAMEANRVEGIKTLLLGIAIVMFFYTLAISALTFIGFVNFTGPQIATFFMTPTVLILTIALMLPLSKQGRNFGGSNLQNPPKLE
jgi:lipopolysaccharide export LptBFGC system permease protein LptF